MSIISSIENSMLDKKTGQSGRFFNDSMIYGRYLRTITWAPTLVLL